MKFSLKSFLILLLIALSFTSYAQTHYHFDFGAFSLEAGSRGQINNISRSYNSGNINDVRLITADGTQTDIVLRVTDDFRGRNTAGTALPNHLVPYSSSQTEDNFYGNAADFGGITNSTGAFQLTGLNPAKLYSFQIFASRMGTNDIRETDYTITGTSTQTVFLDASNNTDQTVEALNIVPDLNGLITISLTAGPSNDNSSKFFYISAMDMLEHDAPLSAINHSNVLTLTYPTAPAVWENGKVVTITWESFGLSDVLVESSDDGGMSWLPIATVPAVRGSYDYTVPQSVGDMHFRVSGNNLSDTSTAVQVIPDDGVEYDIYVLGSSTAAGTGPSHPINTWVNKYADHLYRLDTRYNVVNVAVGGQVTYNLLPTGHQIPAGVNETVNDQGNVTYAIAHGADGIIINLPSNDAGRGYPVADQLTNYQTIFSEANAATLPYWLTTPQPRDFGNNATALAIQQNMLAATWQTYPAETVDFWTGFPVNGDNGLLPRYDSGDGVHANNGAHQIFFERMLAAGIHTAVKTMVDAALDNPAFAKANLRTYPNPVFDTLFISGLDQSHSFKVSDNAGRYVLTGNTKDQIDLSQLSAGIYFLRIGSEVIKLIKN